MKYTSSCKLINRGDIMTKIQFSNQEDESAHLAQEHGLIKTTAYIPVKSDKQKKSANAKRVERHRQRKKEKGLVAVDLPQSVADEIKAAGSFKEWIKQFQRIPPDKVKIINQYIHLAMKVQSLPSWIRWILDL